MQFKIPHSSNSLALPSLHTMHTYSTVERKKVQLHSLGLFIVCECTYLKFRSVRQRMRYSQISLSKTSLFSTFMFVHTPLARPVTYTLMHVLQQINDRTFVWICREHWIKRRGKLLHNKLVPTTILCTYIPTCTMQLTGKRHELTPH